MNLHSALEDGGVNDRTWFNREFLSACNSQGNFKSVWLFTDQSSELRSSSKSAQERRNSWEVGQSLIFGLFITHRSSSQ